MKGIQLRPGLATSQSVYCRPLMPQPGGPSIFQCGRGTQHPSAVRHLDVRMHTCSLRYWHQRQKRSLMAALRRDPSAGAVSSVEQSAEHWLSTHSSQLAAHSVQQCQQLLPALAGILLWHSHSRSRQQLLRPVHCKAAEATISPSASIDPQDDEADDTKEELPTSNVAEIASIQTPASVWLPSRGASGHYDKVRKACLSGCVQEKHFLTHTEVVITILYRLLAPSSMHTAQ